MDTPTVLGISFSTRQTGMAVLKSHSLVDYSLRLYKEKWSPEKRDLIIATLSTCIRTHYISEIVLSIPEEYHQTKQFKELFSAIVSFALINNIPYTSYPVSDIYKSFGSQVRRTRKGLMERLVMLYPELVLYYDREQKNRNKYYVKLFEAIGAVAYHWKENN